MPDRVVQSYRDFDGRAGQSVQSYHSVWMAHWTQTSCSVAPQTHNYSSHPFGNTEDDHDTKQHHSLGGVEFASDILRAPANGFKEVDARTFEIMNETLTVSPKNLRNERLNLGCQPFSLANLCQKNGSDSVSKNDQDTCQMQALRPQIDHNFKYITSALCTSGSRFPSVLALAPPITETSSGDCHFQPEVVSQIPAERLKSHTFLAESSFAVSKPSEEGFVGSVSRIDPRRFDHGEYRFDSRTTVPSFMRRQQEINRLSSILASKEHLSNTNQTILEHEHCNYHRRSAFLVCEKKMDGCSNSGKSVTPYLWPSNASLLLNNPYMRNNHSPVLGGAEYQRNHSGKLFPSWSSPPEATKLEKLHHGDSLQQRMPQSVHDLETMRVCTSVDSVEGSAGGPTGFSKTTHRLLITEKTDFNLGKENQIVRESRVSTQLKGNAFSGLHSLSPLFGHSQLGVKLQPLGSSTDTEGEENVQDFEASKVQKNESSAETDTMDMDSFKEKNHLSGVNSSPSNKEIMVDPNLPQVSTGSAGEEDGCRRTISELPDINLEIPALPAGASSMDNAGQSTSRTQSLDMELLFHPEQRRNLKSNHCLDGHLGPEPSSRWVKRLKLSAANSFAVGTKSSNLVEASSHEKLNQFFSNIQGSISSSEPALAKCHGKDVIVLDQATALLRNGEPSSIDTVKNGGDITLSHAWIQRWRRNQAAALQKKPEAVVVCEPQSSKVALEDFRKKQFPSIAAMALMGKALNGFPPCEFQKKGSFTVWNTKGF